jgi:hypothetical protein
MGEGVASGDFSDFDSTFEGSCGSTGGPDAAYRWTAPSSGSFCLDTLDSSADTVLRWMTGDCETEMDCDDDGAGVDYLSKLEVLAVAGTEYVIVVDAYASWISGDFSLNISEGGCW